jgi:hypothetical protein
LGSTTPTELPIWVSLSANMAISVLVITNVILRRFLPCGCQRGRLGA